MAKLVFDWDKFVDRNAAVCVHVTSENCMSFLEACEERGLNWVCIDRKATEYVPSLVHELDGCVISWEFNSLKQGSVRTSIDYGRKVVHWSDFQADEAVPFQSDGLLSLLMEV